VTLDDPERRFQGHGVITDALDVLCAQPTRDLFAIAKFLLLVRFLHVCCVNSIKYEYAVLFCYTCHLLLVVC